MSSSGRKPFRRALVTGASGFMGRALVRRLDALGVAVMCASRRASATISAGAVGVAMSTAGDVADRSFVNSLVDAAEPDVIFHLAGHVNGSRDVSVVERTLMVNLVGSINVLRSATEAGCQRVILIGSGDEPLVGSVPASPYAAAKAAQASYARMFHDLYGTPVTTARVFMAYGPDHPDSTRIVTHTVTSLLRGERPALSSGRRRCDWVYLDDVVDALVALAQSPAAIGHVVDVGTGELHSVRHVVETVTELMGSKIVPDWGAVADRRAEPENVADVAAAQALAGWSATTDLRTGLARTVSWFTDELDHRESRSAPAPAPG